jgi:hypothetical protein
MASESWSVPMLEHRNFPEFSEPVENCKVGFWVLSVGQHRLFAGAG